MRRFLVEVPLYSAMRQRFVCHDLVEVEAADKHEAIGKARRTAERNCPGYLYVAQGAEVRA